MATTDLIGAQTRADHAVATPTAPLPPQAAAALARALPHFPVVRAVAEYETAAVHAAQLAGLAESGRMSDLDARSLADAEDVMAAARTVLAKAGQLHLVDAMYAKAARFRALSTVIDRLTARDSHYMTPADWRELHGVQDERADLYFELKRAGRLDLVGGV